MAKQQEQQATRDITRVWRHQTDNRAVVEYDEVVPERGATGQKEADKARGPSQAFHDAMDGLATHIAAPYGVGKDQAGKIRPREIRLFRTAGDDGVEVLKVKLYGTRMPEGFEANVPFRIPKQEVTGALKTAVNKVIAAALKYVDGERGQETADLGQ